MTLKKADRDPSGTRGLLRVALQASTQPYAERDQLKTVTGRLDDRLAQVLVRDRSLLLVDRYQLLALVLGVVCRRRLSRSVWAKLSVSESW